MLSPIDVINTTAIKVFGVKHNQLIINNLNNLLMIVIILIILFLISATSYAAFYAYCDEDRHSFIILLLGVLLEIVMLFRIIAIKLDLIIIN